MTTRATTAIADPDLSAKAFPCRVLVAPPKILTIPIFALQGEAGRPAIEVWRISEEEEDKLLDRQASGHLRAGRYGEHRFITTRHKQGLRTASYALWLAFPSDEQASTFVGDHPRYGLDNILSAAFRRSETIERELESGLTKGRYDLGLIDENARYKRAQLFVAQQNDIARLRRRANNVQALRTALTVSRPHPMTAEGG